MSSAELLARAETGDAEAMFAVGEHFDSTNEKAKALEWFERAAQAAATLTLKLFEVGNRKKATEWLRRAAMHLKANAVVGDARLSLCHLAAWCDSADLLRQLIVAGANVKATDKVGATPCHIAAQKGHELIVQLLIGAGASASVADHYARTPCHKAAVNGHVKVVELLIANGASVAAVDRYGRTPLHNAAIYGHDALVAMLIAKGADMNAIDKYKRTPSQYGAFRGLATVDAEVDALGVTNSFDAARSALADARAAQKRQVSTFQLVATLLEEEVAAKGAFGTVAAICLHADEFGDAERKFSSQQDMLRTAEQLDLEVVVALRDAARDELSSVAALVLRCHDAASLGSLAALGNRIASIKAAVAGFQKRDGDATDDNADVDVANWLINTLAFIERASSETKSAADAVVTAVQRLFAGGDADGCDVAEALKFARTVAQNEKAALDKLRFPNAVYGELIAKLDELRGRVVQVLNLVDRARQVRAATAPSCERLQAAQASAAKIEKQIKLALVELEHPEDVESEAAAKEQLRELKAALVEAQRESTAAVVELAAHVYDFPELRLRFPKARFDDFFAVDGGATALRTLGTYDDRTVISVTRNKVERASFGGVDCALKLFNLLPANQRAFVKEARRLRQLAHPNVVEVRAVFVDGDFGVIEMPLYAHGDLWQWLAAAPAPARSVHEKLRVLRATLCGLEHVHRMGVVHADVKPENVFVDADGVAKLGDFDVSKDDATRITMAATVVGFSLAYAAPEIKNGSAASKPGDMYAFGLTLFDTVHGAKPIKERPIDVELLAHHEPIEGGTSLRDITRRLVDQVAANRITASDALKSPLFAPPAPGRDPERDQRDCSVCLESHWLDEGIECDAEHFVCNGDVEATAQIFCSLAPGVIAKQGALRCQEQGCAAAPWSNASLAQSLSAAQFSAYVEKLREVSENLALVEQRQRHEAELVQLQRLWRGELTRDEEVATHRRHIRDGLLCLRCPRCKSAFVIDDFDSCLAMNCASCKAAFCAWCLRDCGADAHAHVNECEHNPTEPRNVFANVELFEEAHRKRYAAVLRDYMRALRNEEIRAAVREAIRGDLNELRIQIEFEFKFEK